MDLPISEIAGNVECCPVINEMDTLDHVLDTMVVTGFQQVTGGFAANPTSSRLLTGMLFCAVLCC
eukprot:1966523-Rhodomonas_salina.1